MKGSLKLKVEHLSLIRMEELYLEMDLQLNFNKIVLDYIVSKTQIFPKQIKLIIRNLQISQLALNKYL